MSLWFKSWHGEKAFENEDNVEEQSFSNGIIQFQDFRGIGLFTPIHLQQQFT